ncbi:DUF1194 domain-containing protein [Salipiger mucosus]|uniref:von Willebrand factor type A domain protein n=1 Tax=Salipiger mucosus DSM 16094 TaxID=1123237 RepID=S9Q9C7_9RHOB|nr:DUF1194 domain-containing protein [Salipiger mucosus]EPX76218.1 Von Willebrand factor type A domain protein [Salipiger mucosus DSM 16094]
MLRLLAALLCLAPAARACETALVLAMDVSNSVDVAEYRLQADGLADALEDPEIAEILVRDGVALAVLQWAGADRQQVSIGWTRMLSPAHVSAFAAQARAMERAFVLSDTAPASALHRALDLFSTAPDCGRRVVDVSGDGTPNAGGAMGGARRRAERMGVTVNGLAIEAAGRGVAITNFYARNLVTRDGFVMTARGHRSYPETLRRKILREISRVLG